jgi:transcriptional regulator with XRE-family HTH domain
MERVELKERLSEALEIRGLRAVDLVELTGIPKVTISYYLSGKTVPRSDKLYKLAQALNVSEAWLLGYDVPMSRNDDQKKNDQLAKLIVKLRTDEGFYNMVSALAGLSENEYRGVEQLVAALKK